MDSFKQVNGKWVKTRKRRREVMRKSDLILAGVAPEVADEMMKVLNGRKDPRCYKSVRAWVKQCFNEPSEDELIMCAFNELLGGYGVEAVWDRSERVVATYVNMGDTYDTTVLHEELTGRYRVTTWGDWVESKRL